MWIQQDSDKLKTSGIAVKDSECGTLSVCAKIISQVSAVTNLYSPSYSSCF